MLQLLEQIDVLGVGHNPVGATQMLFYGMTIGHNHRVADSAFAVPTCGLTFGRRSTESDDARGEQLVRTEPTVLEDPGREIDRAESPALAAVEDLRRWLGISYNEVAQIAGLGSASTIYYWKKMLRKGAEPKPRLRTVERLYRIHAVLRALAEAIQGGDGTQAVQLWSRDPGPEGTTPLDLLRQGQIKSLHELARPLLFDTTPRQPPVARTIVIDEDVDEDSEGGVPRPTRRKLTAADFGY